MPYSTGNADGVKIFDKTADGLAIRTTLDSGTPPTTANVFAKGCSVMALDTGVRYINTGTSAIPSWEIN